MCCERASVRRRLGGVKWEEVTGVDSLCEDALSSVPPFTGTLECARLQSTALN